MNKITNTITTTLGELQKRNALLLEENARLEKQVAELTAMVEWFKERFHLSQKRQFTPRSPVV